jgi:hypothetical protein
MEDKLSEYRLRKRRKETFEKVKEKFLNMVSFDVFVTKSDNDVAVKVVMTYFKCIEIPCNMYFL